MAANFRRHIEGRTPDPDCPGWDTLHLECGHRSGAPAASKDFDAAHCGVCQLHHEAHERAINELQKKLAAGAGGTANV